MKTQICLNQSKKTKVLSLTSLLLSTFIFSGCGQTPYKEPASALQGLSPTGAASGTNSSGVPGGTIFNGTSVGDTSSNTSSQNNSDNTTYVPSAAYSFAFKLLGYSGTEAEATFSDVQTDNLLKVVVRLDQPDPIAFTNQANQYTGYTPFYNCAKVYVTVLGSTQKLVV